MSLKYKKEFDENYDFILVTLYITLHLQNCRNDYRCTVEASEQEAKGICFELLRNIGKLELDS